jgi:activator of HSP90 ATPase
MEVSSLVGSIVRDRGFVDQNMFLNIDSRRVSMNGSFSPSSVRSINVNDSALVCSRRQAVAGIAVALSSALSVRRAFAQQRSMGQQPSENSSDPRTSIHYELDFKSSPQRFYDAIVEQKQFAAFTGMPATIDATAGGPFSMFGGLIVGRNVELVPGQRVVQAWRPSHWDPGIYSLVHFELKPRGQECTLVFDHSSFPAGDYDHLDWGWKNHYWEPLKKYFA